MPPDGPDWLTAAKGAVRRARLGARAEHRGRVEEIGDGVAMISGLRDVRLDEVLRFEGGQFGFARVLDPDLIGCVFVDAATRVESGDAVFGTGEVVSVPVGERCSDASSTRSGARLTERGRSRPRTGGRSSARPPRSSNAIS
jgi:F-type H+-transporting ATPase subunit alpha